MSQRTREPAQSMNRDLDELQTIVARARQRRFYEETGKYTTTPSNSTDEEHPLHRSSARNAYVLAELLEKKGFDPVIIAGGVSEDVVGPDGILRENLPMTIEECEAENSLHFWVETRLRTITLDLAHKSHYKDSEYGQSLVARSAPPDYYYLDDGVGYAFSSVPF